MNETDKMLEEMFRAGEKPAKDSQKETTKKSGNDEIGSLLSDLKEETGIATEKLVFIDCTNEKDLESFWICNHLVTQKEFKEVMGINPSLFQRDNMDLKDEQLEQLQKEGSTENHPVENVSWLDAIYYCNKRSMLEGLEPVYYYDEKSDVNQWGYEPCKGKELKNSLYIWKKTKANGYRLPLDEEWEYAAKGGGKFKYSGSDNIDEVAWYEKNSKDVTHPIMQKKPNGYGLYDMSGNVDEWCWEVCQADEKRVQRRTHGGYYCSRAEFCRLKWKFYNDDYWEWGMGFRVVRTAIN